MVSALVSPCELEAKAAGRGDRGNPYRSYLGTSVLRRPGARRTTTGRSTENLSVRITFDFTDTTYLVRRGKLFPAPSPRFFAVNVLLGNAQVKSYSPNSVPR